MPLDTHIVRRLIDVCGQQAVLTDQSECWAYGYDNSKRHACPKLVVLPKQASQIQKCVQICNEFGISLTTRGRGTSTTGAAVPIQSDIVLSTEHLNQILEIDHVNRNVRVEPGVLNAEVQNRVAEHRLFWPPDPSSGEYCTVGGNLACNAAGPHAVKYGTCRENTLSLRAVTGSGEIIYTGNATTKGVMGLDLTRLLIGSEGILAIITEARLKLSPKAERIDTIRALYKDNNAAIDAVINILAQNALPCALEFIDRRSLDLIRQQTNINLDAQAQAMLIIEVDGLMQTVDTSVEAILLDAKNTGCCTIQAARDTQRKSNLWSARKALSPALRNFAPNKINEDIVVPVSQLPSLLKGLESLSKKYEIPIFSFGHAGNGNLHTDLLYDASNSKEMESALQCLDEVFNLVLKLNGTLSGEHGVGILKRDYISKEIDPYTLSLMQKIKQQFDPNNVLNRGKTLPDITESGTIKAQDKKRLLML